MSGLSRKTYAVGAARREVLELQAHRERASTALAAAQQQIMVLTCALTEARAMPNKSQMASTQEVYRPSFCNFALFYMRHRAPVKCGI